MTLIASESRLDPRAVVRSGLVAGTIAVFIAALGMVEVFDDRKVIDPVLSLGYLALAWIPVLFGYRITKTVVLEGVEAPPTGMRNVVAGAAVGLVGGLFLALFTVLFDTFDVREIFLNVNEQLVDLRQL